MEKKDLDLQISEVEKDIDTYEHIIANKFACIFLPHTPENTTFTYYEYRKQLGFNGQIEGDGINYHISTDEDGNVYTRIPDPYTSKANCQTITAISYIWNNIEEIESNIKDIDFNELNKAIDKLSSLKAEWKIIDNQEIEELTKQLFITGNKFAINNSVKVKNDENRLLECLFPGYGIYSDVSNVKIEVTDSKPNSKFFNYKATYIENGVEKSKEGKLKKRYIVNFVQWKNLVMESSNPNRFRGINDISWFLN